MRKLSIILQFEKFKFLLQHKNLPNHQISINRKGFLKIFISF